MITQKYPTKTRSKCESACFSSDNNKISAAISFSALALHLIIVWNYFWNQIMSNLIDPFWNWPLPLMKYLANLWAICQDLRICRKPVWKEKSPGRSLYFWKKRGVLGIPHFWYLNKPEKAFVNNKRLAIQQFVSLRSKVSFYLNFFFNNLTCFLKTIFYLHSKIERLYLEYYNIFFLYRNVVSEIFNSHIFFNLLQE